MNLVICNTVDRYNGKPLHTVEIHDLDEAVNFHSYNCVWFRQGENLEKLVEAAQDACLKIMSKNENNTYSS